MLFQRDKTNKRSVNFLTCAAFYFTILIREMSILMDALYYSYYYDNSIKYFGAIISFKGHFGTWSSKGIGFNYSIAYQLDGLRKLTVIFGRT